MPPSASARTRLSSGPQVTWLGHATAVAELGETRVLFDPLLRARARAAGKVDAVLVTHSHVDHLNRWSLKAIDRDTHLVVPMGAKHIVADLGFREVGVYRRHGFRPAIDDFGAGYAGLNLLAEFQPSILKLDRRLIQDIGSSRPRQSIVRGVLSV